ncbi:MAG TPA: dihydrofolate reductase family protein [Candidatus Binatus sp.]|jgi:dihydrofolate reductase|nr:dihydrofolate reductase family protein [Candidatus Binatus sp.]
MRKLIVFNMVSVDGFFVDSKGDMRWAHKNDAEWNAFTSGNASSSGVLVFGRITYELMASYWPTPMALQNSPVVAKGMNEMPKIVFSRTLDKVSWSNTKLIKGDLAAEVRKLKQESGPDMVILGSGSIVSQLTQENLIDEHQLALSPIVLGKGRTLFEGVQEKMNLKRTNSRSFGNGTVFVCYQPVA